MDRHGSGKLTIRRMTAEDIGQVVKVERACFSEPWSEEVFHATLLLPYAYYYVAEITADDGNSGCEHCSGFGGDHGGSADDVGAPDHGSGSRIIGECGVRDIVGEGEITNVAVLPEFQGSGIASRMLRTLLDDSVKRGMTAFTLEVREGNDPAVSLYRKFGFITEGVRTGFYENPVEDALIMWKRDHSLP